MTPTIEQFGQFGHTICEKKQSIKFRMLQLASFLFIIGLIINRSYHQFNDPISVTWSQKLDVNHALLV